MAEERYEDCERFVGEDAIRSYLREVEFTTAVGTSNRVEMICIGCLPGGGSDG